MKSFPLSFRMAQLRDVKQAIDFYEEACLIPRTHTRFEVQQRYGITIDGVLHTTPTGALLVRAYKKGAPQVLKIPIDKKQSERESAVIAAIGAEAAMQAALVPVLLVQLRGEHRVEFATDVEVRTLVSGLLMPAYHGSINDIPPPLQQDDYVLYQGRRIQHGLRLMHHEGYLHGDVKPGNIFLDSAGAWWLGDFGSCVPFVTAKENFRGGTLLYQCIGVGADTGRFDFHGLALTILEKIGLLPDRPSHGGIWQRHEVTVAVDTVQFDALRQFLRNLLL
eukprot:m.9932 g.9932  ORF g.9932 m.9932 type:complete len:278 (+) comp2468_c0_seq1:509-1342(+)